MSRLTRRLSSFVLVASGVAVWASTTVDGTEPPRTVLTIHWSSEDYPVIPPIDGAIREVFRTHPDARVDYFAEYFESDRFPEEVASLSLRDYILRKYRGRRIDVVLAVAEPALQFALRFRGELFPDSPIVSSTVTLPAAAIREAGAGLTGVVSRLSYVETLDLALQLHPSAGRVFVVAQSAPDGFGVGLRESLAPLASRVELTYINEPSVPALLAAVKAIPPGSLLYFVRHSQEEPGNILYPDQVARLVAQVAHVPIYVPNDRYIGTGVVGGVVRSHAEVGRLLGEQALRILDGARAQDLPAVTPSLVTAFDWRQVQRWGINPSRLPPGSSIRFRTPTAWQTYRLYIAGALALMALQGLLIGMLVFQRARRRDVEARHAAILQAAPDMMFLLTREGVLVDCHAPEPGRLTASPDQFLGRHLQEVLPAEVAATIQKTIRSLMPGEPPAVVEYSLRVLDGERQFEARIVPCKDSHMLAVVRDVTERKEAEAALVDSRERYSLATAAGRVGVWDWDLDTDELYVDPLLKAILGYEDREVGNHFANWSQLIYPDDASMVLERAREHVNGASPRYEVEHRMLHRGGGIRWFLASGSVVKADRRASRMIGTYTDITERKSAEQALQLAQGEVARLSRLTALGEFAASIAHEVRQPLGAIILNAQASLRWLDKAVFDLDELRETLRDVIQAGLRAKEVIHRNRQLFTHHIVKAAPVDVGAVVEEATRLAQARLQLTHVTLSVSATDDLPPVAADSVGLQQVLLNLIANSIDAMEGVVAGPKHIVVTATLQPDGMVQVSVSDTGVGLDGVDLERMFELSYTTKSTGTGVGLSVSRSIVEAHGGRLWASRNSESGATFSFTIPSAVPTRASA